MRTKDKRICPRAHFDTFREGIVKGNATLAVIPIGADIHPLFGKDGYASEPRDINGVKTLLEPWERWVIF